MPPPMKRCVTWRRLQMSNFGNAEQTPRRNRMNINALYRIHMGGGDSLSLHTQELYKELRRVLRNRRMLYYTFLATLAKPKHSMHRAERAVSAHAPGMHTCLYTCMRRSAEQWNIGARDRQARGCLRAWSCHQDRRGLSRARRPWRRKVARGSPADCAAPG